MRPGTFHKFGRRQEGRRSQRAVEGEGVCCVQAPTLVLLDGQHGQSIDGLVGGERSTQGTAQEVLEVEIHSESRRKLNRLNNNRLNNVLLL